MPDREEAQRIVEEWHVVARSAAARMGRRRAVHTLRHAPPRLAWDASVNWERVFHALFPSRVPEKKA